MPKTELKDMIHKAIDTIDDEVLLNAVLSLMKEYADNEVVGYVGNKPLTRADLIKQAFKAEEDIKAGRVYDIETVRERFKNKAVK
jgi:hypothetical protein